MISINLPKKMNFEIYAQQIFRESDLKLKEVEFMQLKEPLERINLVYDSIKLTKSFEVAIADTQERKSNVESEKFRILGNDYFIRDKNLAKAIEYYTKSVAYAENGSSQMALAYGNRSAVLFKGNYFKECIEDIDRAASLECPDNIKTKLLSRKKIAEKNISMQKEIKFHADVPVIKSKNPLISCAENCVKIVENKKFGRHVVATRNIKVGEIISVEDTFAHLVHPEGKYIHCHECLGLCYNMIPCDNCTNALYCSNVCKNKDFEIYHKYECYFPNNLVNSETPMVFIKASLKGLKDSRELKSSDNMHKSDSFEEILKLPTHEDKRNFLNLCVPAIAASLVCHVLKLNDKFTSEYTADDEQKLKEFLYKTFMIEAYSPFNIMKNYKDFFVGHLKRCGTALYAFTSLFNHSCVPNCFHVHYGNHIVIRTQDNVSKGEQLTISYSKSFSTTPKPLRQHLYNVRYNFECECKACKNDWPVFNLLYPGPPLPVSYEMKMLENCVNEMQSCPKLKEEILSETIKLFCKMKKYEPCQHLVRLQNFMTEIYEYDANWDVLF